MNRKILLLPLVLIVTLMARAEATHLKVVPLIGVEQQYALTQIGKITFAEGVMFLYDKMGVQLGSTPVNQVGKIVFGEGPQTPTSLDETGVKSVQVFPNPTQEMLIVRGLQGAQILRIYNVQGQLMQSVVTNGDDVNLRVSGLQDGTYLLQVGAEIVKFIKKQ